MIKLKTGKTVKHVLSLLMLVSVVPLGTISASAVNSISGDGTPDNIDSYGYNR